MAHLRGDAIVKGFCEKKGAETYDSNNRSSPSNDGRADFSCEFLSVTARSDEQYTDVSRDTGRVSSPEDVPSLTGMAE